MALATSKRERLADAHLYFVCDARDRGVELEALLSAALAGGADIIQLRDRVVPRDQLPAAARTFRRLADRAGALFIVNDDPELALEAGADGVHLGQDDLPVAAARRTLDPEAIVGLSTHSPDQLAAACAAEGVARPDYLSVGPIWETPTKPGRPATGIVYVSHAAREAALPWFAIGGIDPSNVDAVVAAGATRAVVVRALRDADDPAAAARSLRDVLTHAAGAGL